MIDKLNVWANRFKWLILILSMSIGGVIGLFLSVGTAEGPQFYLRFMVSLAIAWAVLVGIGWLLSHWIKIED